MEYGWQWNSWSRCANAFIVIVFASIGKGNKKKKKKRKKRWKYVHLKHSSRTQAVKYIYLFNICTIFQRQWHHYGKEKKTPMTKKSTKLRKRQRRRRWLNYLHLLDVHAIRIQSGTLFVVYIKKIRQQNCHRIPNEHMQKLRKKNEIWKMKHLNGKEIRDSFLHDSRDCLYIFFSFFESTLCVCDDKQKIECDMTSVLTCFFGALAMAVFHFHRNHHHWKFSSFELDISNLEGCKWFFFCRKNNDWATEWKSKWSIAHVLNW